MLSMPSLVILAEGNLAVNELCAPAAPSVSEASDRQSVYWAAVAMLALFGVIVLIAIDEIR
jgi:hypothetical protein